MGSLNCLKTEKDSMDELDPPAAYAFLQAHPEALLIDCRTEIEYLYVGHPVGAEHIAWQEAPDWAVDPDFVRKVLFRAEQDLSRPVLLICRSGRRSAHAAICLHDAGFMQVINIREGFEGELDGLDHRGTLGGWRFHGLPWQQS